MKKTALKFYPYLFLAAILTVLIILFGRGMRHPKTDAERVAAKKPGAHAVKKSNHADRHKKSPKRSGKRVAQKLIYEIVSLDETETTTSDLGAPAATATPSPTATPVPEPAVEPAPEQKPAPAPTPTPEPVATLPDLKPAPRTPVAFVPKPDPIVAPLPAIASNTILTAEQALSLQSLYPGISQGWTIEQYEKAEDEFYARYEKWGGDTEPAAAAFQEFLTAIGEEKPKAGLSFPRSWLVSWRNGTFIQETEIERLVRTSSALVGARVRGSRLP